MPEFPEGEQTHINRGQRGYGSPEAMLEAFQANRHQGRLAQAHSARHRLAEVGWPSPLLSPFACAAFSEAPALEPTSQASRQWNLVTIKRCVVTRAEFQYWGSIETVLQKKGFPTKAPEDGTVLLSWFDQASSCAFYELARVQDQRELTNYMLEHFQPLTEEGVERLITFPDEE